MIRKAMEILKKTKKGDDAEKSSVQMRLNEMLRQQSETTGSMRIEQSRTDKKYAGTGGGQPDATSEDEAFLRRFAEKIYEKPSYQQTTEQILKEQAEERKKRMNMAPVNGAPKNGTPVPQPNMFKSSIPDPVELTDGTMPDQGSILYLSDGQVAIFNKNVASRNYQLVHMINGDGTLSSQGIYLSGYQYEQIGKLSPDAFAEMQQSLSWDRDLLVFHLNNYRKASLLPRPTTTVIPKVGIGSQSSGSIEIPKPAPVQKPAPEIQRPVNRPVSEPTVSENTPPVEPQEAISSEPEREQPEEGLCRGRRFKISMGRNRTWEAIYWGKDQQGTVIAHNTNGQWALMHLDLDRFASSMEMNGRLDEKELREVESVLREHYS